MRARPFLTASLCVLAAAAVARPPAAPRPPDAPRPLAPIILDPGHGGHDLGAVANGLQEKDIALAVALKVRERLAPTLPVRMTRDDDRFVKLDERVVDAADWNGAMFVSIHLNQVRSRSTSGATVYSYGAPKTRRRGWRRWLRRRRRAPPMPAPPRVESAEGGELADAIATRLRRAGVSAARERSDYYVLKEPSQPSVLVELGYLSNRAEARRLADPAYQDKLADAIARAVRDFAARRAVQGEAPSTLAENAAAPARL